MAAALEKVNIGDLNPGEDKIGRGYLEQKKSWRLSSKYFPSKVGGLPAWLALSGLPEPSRLTCRNCSGPMVFMLQLYIPDSTKDYAFHRTMFVFACRVGSCHGRHNSDGLRVFRCNLPRQNKFYSSEPPTEQEATCQTPSAMDHNKLCYMCGNVGNKDCEQCHCVNYCSDLHQDMHLQSGHLQECQKLKRNPAPSTIGRSTALFPEAEIVLEVYDEDCDDDYSDCDDEELTADEVKEEITKITQEYNELNIDLSKYNAPKNLQPGESTHPRNKKGMYVDREGFQELEHMAMGDTDKDYTNFAEYVDEDPTQVVRYERCGKPLYCGSRYKPGPNTILSCPHCSKKRQFEFQVMPQLLNHLKVDSVAASMDWGCLYIYTCFCNAPEAYTEEQIFKQDFLFHGNQPEAENVDEVAS